MQLKRVVTRILAVTAVSVAAPAFIFAQGSLTPPAGAPAPTMKSLDQIYTAVETLPSANRIPVRNADLPLTIVQPGSYYLAEPIIVTEDIDAINVVSNDVTIDLNGYSMMGPGKDFVSAINATAIRVASGVENTAIKNGMVRGWPGSGISREGLPTRTTVDRVQSVENKYNGFQLGTHATVTNCQAAGNGTYGILAHTYSVYIECIATGNGFDGFFASDYSSLTRCTASSNVGDGFESGAGAKFESCQASNNNGNGFNSGSIEQSYRDCKASGNDLSGFAAVAGAVIHSCEANRNDMHGILLNGTNCSIIDCTLFNNGMTGISVLGISSGLVRGCVINSNVSHGINVVGGFLITENMVSGNGNLDGDPNSGAGIRVSVSAIVIKNRVITNDIGIESLTQAAYVAQNFIASNTPDLILNGSTVGTGDLANVQE